MDNASNYDAPNYDSSNNDSSHQEWDRWLEISNSDEKLKPSRRCKKRRKPPRKNRKPSRPQNYIGQRSNNHLLRILSD